MTKKLLFAILLFLLTSIPFQLLAGIAVVGAKHVKASTDSKFRLECMLIQPEAGFSVRLEAASPTALLKKYHTRASDAEVVEGATYSNGAWVLQEPELNCGYIVEKGQGLSEYYWLADYNSSPLPQGELYAAYSPDSPCDRIILSTKGGFSSWTYYSPDGTAGQLTREFQIRYFNALFSEEDFAFKIQEKEEQLVPQENTLQMLAPLTDTSFRLLGDKYSAIFEPNFKSLESNMIPSQRLEVYTRYKVLGTSENKTSEGSREDGLPSALSAPVSVKMEAVANEPAAQRYIWRILPAGNESEEGTPLLIFTGKECEFTFDKAGSFVLFVEVGARNGSCLLQSDKKTITIGASRLEVPNAFSPFSSPGINDTFRVAHNSIVSFQGAIFNEWGNKLYEWKDPNEGWDGTFRGKPVDTGVYYYIIHAKGADGKEYNLNGHINILGYGDVGIAPNPVTP